MTVTSPASLDNFLLSGSSEVMQAASGNTSWAIALANEVRELVARQAAFAPRSQQVHLGPSELGVACDRQVVGKLVREARTNHVADPWPSVVGTALHAWLADAFAADDPSRWVTEHRVIPHPDHSGTADLYDHRNAAVLDHKCLGASSLAKIRRPEGPPRKYVAQLYLYGLGYLRAGLPVKRVGIIAYPRTESTLSGLYVWEAPFGDDAVRMLADVFEDTRRRKAYAELVAAGRIPLSAVPRDPTRDECYFCPFYRPQTGHDPSQVGCPGTVTPTVG